MLVEKNASRSRYRVEEDIAPLLSPIDNWEEDPKNARRHTQRNLEEIKNSILSYGQVKPIIVNKESGIIEAGNGFWRVCKDLEWTHIAVIKVKHDHRTAMGFAIADNRTAQLAEWNYSTLKDLYIELDTGEKMPAIGFNDSEMEDLMTRLGDEYHKSEITISPEVFESHNFIVLYFDNELDWKAAQDTFGLKSVKAPDSKEGYVRAGIGRVIPGKEVLREIIESRRGG